MKYGTGLGIFINLRVTYDVALLLLQTWLCLDIIKAWPEISKTVSSHTDGIIIKTRFLAKVWDTLELLSRNGYFI
ncbi:MAG: hypothetical protein CL489_06300 [Acidobacteria bacterium]|nr:hypothetical protein [Acidobacteriota bacterium]